VSATPDLNQRVLTVTPGMYLTGLVGQVGDGKSASSMTSNLPVITRLGILQCAKPGEEHEETPMLQQVQRLLWSGASVNLASNGAKDAMTAPIWRHPQFRMIPFHLPEGLENPIDIIPHDVLLWAKEESELKRLVRISALVTKDGIVTDASGSEIHHVHSVLGLRAEYEERYWEPKRSICSKWRHGQSEPGSGGSGEPESQKWPEENLVHFDIDGPGGEIVTEIHVAHDVKAVKLRTNRGRWSYFGEIDRNGWDVRRPGAGEVLVGMVVSFATRNGFNWETQESGSLKMTTVTGLVMSVEQN
jgi:hypothetical protein